LNSGQVNLQKDFDYYDVSSNWDLTGA
jgi:hypothetical protein